MRTRKAIKRLNSAEFWSLAALLFRIGSGLLLLPIAVRSLSASHLGLWYIMLSVTSLSSVVEMGFSGMVVRSVAAYWGGADNLRSFGLERQVHNRPPNVNALREVGEAMRRIYGLFALAFLLAGSVATFFWIPWPAGSFSGDVRLAGAWLLFFGSGIVLLYTRWQPAALQGVGSMKTAQRIELIAAASNLLVGYTLLSLGAGLMGLAIAQAMQALVSRTLARKCLPDAFKGSMFGSRKAMPLFMTLWPMTWRSGLISAANYCATSGPVLVVGATFGLEVTSKYALSAQIVQLLQSVAVVPLSSRTPEITIARARWPLEDTRQFILARLGIGLAIYTAGAILIFIVGRGLLECIGSRTELLAPIPLALILLSRLLDLNHIQFWKLCAAFNINNFAVLTALNAVFVPIAAWLGAKFFGLTGLICAVMLVQLCYTNWAPVLQGLHELELNYRIAYTGMMQATWRKLANRSR